MCVLAEAPTDVAIVVLHGGRPRGAVDSSLES